MAQVEIKLLGEVRVNLPSGEAAAFPTRKALALFLFLALPAGRSVTRERLAGMFWSRNAEEQARTNLRQCLSRMRKSLGDDANIIIAHPHDIELDHNLVTTDLDRLESYAAQDDPGAWSEAASLLTGKLAEGLSLNEPDFDDWVEAERRRYNELALSVLSRFLNHLVSSKDFDQAAEVAMKLLTYDPLDERAHKELMNALARLGRFEAALQQYKLCRDILRKELAIDPSDDVRALRDEIARERSVSREVPNAPAVETDDLVEALGRTSSGPEQSIPNLPAQLDGLTFRAPERPSIVILPFNNLTGDPDQEYLADGIRIDIQAALVKVTGVFLIAAGSANAMRGKDCQTAGKALGVRYALQGSIRKAGNKLRVSAELIDVQNGEAIWTEVYDRDFDDGFTVQDEIVSEIIKALDIKLLSGENAAVWHKTLKDRDALEYFYKGVHEFFKLQKPSMLRARRAFEAVDRMQPDVSIGATWAALCHWFDAFKGWRDRQTSLDEAEAWSEKAVAMDDPDGQAHMVLSHVHLMKRRFDDALIVGREAVQLRPNCTNANGFFANVLHYCGEQNDAIEHVTWAIRYSPVYPPFFADVLSLALLFNDMNEASIAIAQESLRLNPDGLTARLVMTAAQWRNHDHAKAGEIVDRITTNFPEFSVKQYAELQPYRSDKDRKALSTTLVSAGLPH